MSPGFSLRIKNQIAEIPPAAELAAAWLLARGVPEHETFFARLVIDEVVSNCVKYGYDDPDEHLIAIAIEIDGDSLALSIEDDGQPFNPLEFPEPDTSLPVEERPIGGLGIHLLRKMADRIEYERTNSRNRLTLFKSITSSTDP